MFELRTKIIKCNKYDYASSLNSMNSTKMREGVFSIPKCINPTKLNSKNTSKENKNECNAIFNFQ